MQSNSRQGILFALGAFGLWGIFPLYFRALDASGALEILSNRVIWSLVFCLLFVFVARKAGSLKSVLRDKRLVTTLGAAALAVGANWGIYIYAVNSDQVIEASLGYFINPLVTVVLGVFVLNEKLRPTQWAAVAIGAVAVVVLTVAYGHVPLIAISLALSFGLYGLIKNKVGSRVDALSGLATETIVLFPIAAAGFIWFAVSGNSTFTQDAPVQALLLMSAGIITIIPLLFFAGAARRLPLSTVGLLQYLTPVLQLLCGVVILDEHMPLARWLGFGLVWVALATLTFDGLKTKRRNFTRVRLESIQGA